MNRLKSHIDYHEEARLPGRPAWVFNSEKDRSLRLHWSYGMKRSELCKLLGVSRSAMFKRARKLGLYIQPRKKRAPPISPLSTHCPCAPESTISSPQQEVRNDPRAR